MRVFLVILCVVIVVLASLWVLGNAKQNRLASEPWPGGLGTLRDIPGWFPKAPASPAANELTRLSAPLASVALREPLAGYLKAELERPDAAIGAPPQAVAEFLAAHGEQLAAVRRHLIRAAPISFAVDLVSADPPVPNLGAHVQLLRLLAADALDRARRGEAVGWDDLEASWRLERALFLRPEEGSQLAALSGVRLTAAAARKMPLPGPYWLAELAAFDPRAGYLRAMQANTWVLWRRRGRARMIRSLVEDRRRLAGNLSSETRCAFDGYEFLRAGDANTDNPISVVDLSTLMGPWERLLRTRAELELTDRVIAARSGGPPRPRSRCSDGQWLYETRPDGSMALRFSHELPENHAEDAKAIRYPVEFAVPRTAASS